MTTFRIAALPGDGIGPEVTVEAMKALRAVEARLPLRFELEEFSVGAGEYLRGGDPLPTGVIECLQRFDAVLLGAMGLPDVRWPNGTEMAPQLDIRERLDLYAGHRPIRLYQERHTPLKGYRAGEIDFVIVREQTEGLFWSRKGTFSPDANDATDTLRITRPAAERVCRYAFELARKRRGLVTLVDKANVLPSMAFFRMIFREVASAYPDIRSECVYVDAAGLYLVQRPHTFDVIVTENMFGDILSDLAAALIGGMGMAPSGDIGERYGVFQPSHGSAPDIAGQGKANPVAMILSAALMLEWLGRPDALRAAALIHRAVETALADPGNGTPDLRGSLTTAEMGDRIANEIRSCELA
ncbi:MAG: isocitrate/isopropylmalate dehydrogenase family protein [Bryobacteraceae bacterium]|nr:isocitrate/isopropylmalate dehydrogenase family protein [Bryobacteraceae bacterium]